MRKIIFFDTSVGSLNIGDQIINKSFEKEMKEITDGGFIVKYPTHTPVSHFYQNTKFNRFYRYVKSCDLKFIAGTNILSDNLFEPWPNWNINIFNAKPYKNSILVGCGFGSSKNKVNLYTKMMYKKILSKDYIHSVRDKKTKDILDTMGYKAINTGCPTMWSLTKEHCSKIPTQKSENVVFTLTDYKRDKEKDQKLIDILKNNYKKVYYWIQGSNDLEYFKLLHNTEDIILVNPNLIDYKEILKNENVDYVGTRLHAGIFAMQNFVRSIILIIDNRARDIKETYNIVAIERNKILELESVINSKFETKINIDEEKIKEWKNQFIVNEKT